METFDVTGPLPSRGTTLLEASARTGRFCSAPFMNSWKTRAGSPPPVACFMGVELSLPIHTPQTRSDVKPMNQASRKSWVVPVLPALGRSSSRAALPVPLSTVSCNSRVMAALSAWLITAPPSGGLWA